MASFQHLPIHLQSYILAVGAAPLNTCKAAVAITDDLQLTTLWLAQRYGGGSDAELLQVAYQRRHWGACIWALENRRFTLHIRLNQALLEATKAGQLGVVQKLMQHGGWAGWLWEHPPREHFFIQEEDVDELPGPEPPEHTYTQQELLQLYAQPTPLEEAARLGHLELLHLFLLHPASLQVILQAFLLAAANGQLAAVELLAHRHPGILGRRQVVRVALCRAAKGGHMAVVQLLIDRVPGLSQAGLHGNPLAIAALGRQVSMMHFFLQQQGADPQGRPGHPWSGTDSSGCSSPLWSSAASGSCEPIQLLLDAGVPVQAFHDSGAIAAAVANSSTSAVQLLLGNGSPPDMAHLRRAIHSAVIRAKPGIVRMLLQSAPNPTALLQPSVDSRGPTDSALCRAVHTGCLETVRAILSHCNDAGSIDGCEAMLRAAQKNWVPIMHLLVEHGMQVQGAAYTDGSPLAMAIQHNSLEAVQWLLQQGAQADREALVKALHSRAFRCVQPLLQHGVRDTDDRALYTAAQLGSLEAVQLLLSAAANSPEGVPDSAAQVELVLCGAASMGQLGIVQWLLGREASPPEAGAAASPRPSTHLRHHCTPAVLTKALEALILGSEFRYVHPSWGWEQEGPPWGYGSYRDPFSQQDLQALARLLLESGADLDADSGRLVLMAISGSEYSLVRQLCEASPGPVVTSGLALHAAQVAHDTQAFVSLLPLTDLSRADTNAALLFAVQRRCIQQVCALLMWGADANCYGGAPLSAAIQQHSNEVAALLLQHGAQPDASQVQRLVAFAGPQLLHLLEARSLMPSSMARPGLV